MDKIICFGKNYQDHMLELGDAPVTRPVIFLKPPSVLKQCQNWGEKLIVHVTNTEVSFECEVVIKLNKGGYKMTPKEASEVIGACTIGLDMTLRKEQAILKKNGHPWEISKIFPDSCLIGPWLDINNINFMEEEFKFTLNHALRQKSCGKNMLFKPNELISYASQFFPLCQDDIIFTGTPSGVGPINSNSTGILEIAEFKYTVEWRFNSNELKMN